MKKLETYTENRPWGSFTQFSKNEPSTVKIITVNSNAALSLQHHAKRREFWKIIGGEGIVTVGEEEYSAKVGDEFMIEIGELHRIKAGENGITFLEIAFGDFDEADIVRIEDEYGRV